MQEGVDEWRRLMRYSLPIPKTIQFKSPFSKIVFNSNSSSHVYTLLFEIEPIHACFVSRDSIVVECYSK